MRALQAAARLALRWDLCTTAQPLPLALLRCLLLTSACLYALICASGWQLIRVKFRSSHVSFGLHAPAVC
jgi:hypothetical protein